MLPAQILAEKLLARSLKIATAESCTGGLLAAQFTELAGASNWFDRAIITYSNEAKQQLLGVKTETLAMHGAVSEACVREMLAGLLRQDHIDIGVAISGVAGPEGGSSEKPVGTVWFAFGIKKHTAHTHLKLFSGDRQAIREQACVFAIQQLTEILK